MNFSSPYVAVMIREKSVLTVPVVPGGISLVGIQYLTTPPPGHFLPSSSSMTFTIFPIQNGYFLSDCGTHTHALQCTGYGMGDALRTGVRMPPGAVM